MGDIATLVGFDQIKKYVVYRVPVTGTRSPRIAYRQSLWLADMWHAY